MRLYDYIREEVSRQGHDVTQAEGQLRIAWMWDAWEWAQARSHDSQRPLSLDDIAHIGKRIEPDKNARGFRTVGVRVGPRLCPPPADVIPQLTDLLDRAAALAPLEFYKAFELIHPFVDGNGRTGKVLLAWRQGTWDDPEFPPADLFGAPIRNP